MDLGRLTQPFITIPEARVLQNLTHKILCDHQRLPNLSYISLLIITVYFNLSSLQIFEERLDFWVPFPRPWNYCSCILEVNSLEVGPVPKEFPTDHPTQQIDAKEIKKSKQSLNSEVILVGHLDRWKQSKNSSVMIPWCLLCHVI